VREGVASRATLAQMLSGNEEWELEFWDRVLMDNLKRWPVGKHQILKYDKEAQTFFLNFELADSTAVEQAKAICERKIEAWIQKAEVAESSYDSEESGGSFPALQRSLHSTIQQRLKLIPMYWQGKLLTVDQASVHHFE
jgi:hypothetical protein